MRVRTAIASLLIFTFLGACNSGEDADFFVSPERAQELVDKKGARLIDLRTPAEYYESHLPDALLLDISEEAAFRKGLEDLDKRRVYVLYCRSGHSSPRAVGILREQGFRKVYAIEGGFLAWPWPL